MNILAFNTSGNFLSIGLRAGDDFYEENRSSGLKHSEHLLPVVKNLVDKASLEFSDLDLVVCIKGPGSFTGLRIGMATAKGLSSGSNTPLVSINSLDLLARGFDFFDGAVVPVIDARKKRYYTAVYRNGERATDFFDIELHKLVTVLNEYDKVLFTGSDSLLIKEAFLKADPGRKFLSFYYPNSPGLSSAMIDAGIEAKEKYGADPEDSGPFYIRMSDAEPGAKRNV
jgi:tRNA threonylcarbamoyladenosine biosynthesis protein TsaB